jgi:copper(I)-binding protein
VKKEPGRRLLLQAGLVSGLQLGVTGGLALAARPARACEFFASTLRVTHPWTRATGDDDTTAIVCMRFDEVRVDERLIGIETTIATGAEMAGHGAGSRVAVDIPQGRETLLSEHGTFIRLTGLLMPLDAGRAYPIRLLFAVAGPLRADLTVDYARFR